MVQFTWALGPCQNTDDPQLGVQFNRGGYYDWPKDLLERLVPAIRKYYPSIAATSQNASISKAHASVAYMLGLRVNEWWTLSNRSTPYTCDLKTGIYSMFVYTDIIHYQVVI